MPRPAEIPDLERQVGSVIGRVEALERKRPEFVPEPQAATGGLPTEAVGYTNYEGTGANDGSTNYAFNAIPTNTDLFMRWTLDSSSGTSPFTITTGAYNATTTGGWIAVNLSVLFSSDSGTVTGGVFYTPIPAGITGKYFTQQMTGGAAANNRWGATLSSFSLWPEGSAGIPVSFTVFGTGTARLEAFGDYGNFFQATLWQSL